MIMEIDNSKKNKVFTTIILLCFSFINAFSQKTDNTSTGNEFSLQSAIEYATKHNGNYLNAELDKKIADYRNKEVIGLGLPQISGSFDIKDYVELPTSLLPGQFFGAPAGTFIPVRFGTQWNASAGISVSQLIFSSDYLVGLQAAKEFKLLSEKSLTRSKIETVVNVSKAYYSVLVNREKIKTLDANIERIRKIFDDTKALNKAGFVEKLDVDRLELTYNNLLTEKEKVDRLIGLSETLLKFQMGYPIQDPITLSDGLKAEQIQDISSGESKPNYSSRPEFMLLESQQKINELDLKRYKLQHLPSLFAYGAYQRNAQRTKFDLFDTEQEWFPIGLIGATLNVPIFNGGQKYYRIQQAKINLLKTSNTMNMLKSAIDMETTAAGVAYKNAFVSLQTQQKNKELAKSIFDTSKKKYEAGVGSSIELLNAETSLKEAETNYLSAVYDLIIAKIDLDKAQGNLK
jgi:outer membrane protein TolC